jgi:hypothetical protein
MVTSLRPSVVAQGCNSVDDELVTLQQKLVDVAGFQIDGTDPPPYFLRALAAGQQPTDVPQIAPLVGNLETIVMATDQVDL